MIVSKKYEFWFLTGSQHLYGPETLIQVEENSKKIIEGMNNADFPFNIVFKSVLKTPEEISKAILEANSCENCAGIITWMHTFSPSKMWIAGLSSVAKPMLHFHTQFNRDIPWDKIDMDFMNLNQSAHGDREHGFINTRLGIPRKVVVGHWEDGKVLSKIDMWMSTAVAHCEGKNIKVARFGDNMRHVAVTEGDKVEAQIKFGWQVNGFGVGDLVEYIDAVSDEALATLMAEYEEKYDLCPEGKVEGKVRDVIIEQARIELGMKAFLDDGGFTAFTTTFEDLHGIKQLPGLAVQRLMEQGYGFGGEGDWKTAAFTRMMKVMARGQETSFMEDYTYHFEPGNEMVLGAHMIEVCPTISSEKPKLEVHHLGIGGKGDTARLVFDSIEGKALNASLIDLGNRFRLIINVVDAVKAEKDMPKLPVARVLWKPEPSLNEAAEAWIYAGGAHHTTFSTKVTVEQLMDWAEMAGIEYVVIDKNTKLATFRQELKISEMAYKLR